MTRPISAFLGLATIALAGAPCSASPLPKCPITNGGVASYDIVRGGNVIGHQTVRYAVSGADLTVTIDVAASLHALGMRVYRYEHHGEERWHDGQMVGLVSHTDDDGTPRQVDATRDPQGVWHGVLGASPGPAPLLSSSLWNIQTVVQTRLLDRETGEVVPVHAGPPEAQTLDLSNRQVSATKYDLNGPAVKGSVWYDGNGCWVQALFHTRVDGSVIELHAH